MILPFHRGSVIRTLLVALLLCCCVLALSATNSPVIRAGIVYGYPPYVMKDALDRPAGFTIDLISAVLEQSGASVVFTSGEPALLTMLLEQGEIDLITNAVLTPGLQDRFDTTIPYLSVDSTIIVGDDTPLLSSYEELSGKRVGLIRDDTPQEVIDRVAAQGAEYSFSCCGEALKALSSGDLDAVIMQRNQAWMLIDQLELANVQVGIDPLEGSVRSYGFAVGKGDEELLQLLDEGISAVLEDGTADRLQALWFSPDVLVQQSVKPLIIGGDSDFPPYEYLDDQGNPAGFSVDLTRAIAEIMDIPIEFRLGPWGEIYEDLLSGKVDMMQGLVYSAERDESLAFSPTSLIMNYSAVVREGDPPVNTFRDLTGKTVLVQRHDIMHQMLLEMDIELDLITYTSQQEVLKRLAEGEGDCAFAAQESAFHWVNTLGLDQLRITSNPFVIQELNYAVLDEQEQLLLPFNAGLAALKSSGEFRELYTRWFGTGGADTGLTGEDLKRIAISILIPALLIFLLVSGWVRSLRHRVAKRTAELDETARRLTEKVQELEQIKETLAEREERFQYAVEGTREGLWDWNMSTGASYYSEQYARMLGYDHAELSEVGRSWDGLVHPDDRDAAWKQMSSCIEQHRDTYESVFRMRSRDGSYRWISSRARVIYDREGQAVRIVGFNSDISERVAAENAVRDTERKFQDLFERLTDPVCLLDGGFRFIELNATTCRVFGYSREEMMQMDFSRIIDAFEQGEQFSVLRMLLAHNDLTIQKSIVTKAGDRIPVEINLNIVPYAGRRAVLAMVRDITERKMNEAIQQRAVRLESLGQLAGGIAHDFNNLLGGLYGYIELAQLNSGDGPAVEEYLNHALRSFTRTRDLTEQLLTFSKGGAPKRRTGRIEPLVRESAAFALSGSAVSCSYEFDEPIWLVDFDANQISQVIDNLVINAQQAMPSGGEIIITVKNRRISSGEIEELSRGEYVQIDVADTGVGMDRSLLAHIFDPYFTTKSRGNGLGLATSYSIIARHEGVILVSSEVAQGSTFTLLLPRSRSAEAQPVPEPQQHAGGGVILVMDDEKAIRDITSAMLNVMGYDAEGACSGEEALELLSPERAQPVTAVICDLTVPGHMGGRELVGRIRTFLPDLPVFASSGYSEDPIMARPQEYAFTASIAKPYRMKDLGELLQKYLSE
ncbi:MAG: transporter substrate-binding domain-containing protein [Spirochaetia bacterium]|nr:transporter substrate-binding domain-containing protein [Spirochaetia bacterium]